MDSTQSNFKRFLDEIGSYYSVVDEQEISVLRKKQDTCFDFFEGAPKEYSKCLEGIDDKYSELNKTFRFQTEKAAKQYKMCITGNVRKTEDCHESTWKELHNNMKKYIALLRRIDTRQMTY